MPNKMSVLFWPFLADFIQEISQNPPDFNPFLYQALSLM